MTDAAEINEEAETAMMEAAAAPAEESDGYEDSDDDAGHEPDSPNAVAAAALQTLLEEHEESPFGHGVAAGVEAVLEGGARGRQAAASLKSAAICAREAFVKPKMGAEAEADLAATAEALLDALLELWRAEHDDSLRDAIARCGEAWWAREQAPFAAPRVLPYLLVRALSDAATADDVSRCALSSSMLAPVDLNDVSAAGLRGLLAATASAPAFLRSAKGKDFVAGVFRGGAQACAAAHLSVKAALVGWTPSRCKAAGDCYKRALEELVKDGAHVAFEEDYLQDLARAFLFCKSKKLSVQLKALLDSALHCSSTASKARKACVERVYAPLLWRHITQPNGECRRRSLEVLGSCFPIVDPNSSKDVTSTAIERQLQLIKAALTEDPCPECRSAACHAAGHALSTCWPKLPKGPATHILRSLGATCCRDTTSPVVREAALKALTACASSKHVTSAGAGEKALRKALRDASRHLHDTSPVVRNACAHLLGAYAQAVSIDAAFAAVGSENLLQRIAEDDESRRGSSQAIAKLLVKAYFPLEDGSRQVALAAALYNKKPLAARAFYGRLAELAPPEDVARFVVMASKAASEVGDAFKKRKSTDEHEAPSSHALVAVAATAYASLARGPLSANTEGARKLAAYVGDGVASPVQALVDAGVTSDDLRGLRTAVALGGLKGSEEAEAGAAKSKAQRRDGIQAAVAPSDLLDTESIAASADAAARLAGRGPKQAGDVARTLAETLFASKKSSEEPGTRKRGRAKIVVSSSAEAAACAISRIVLGNDPTARGARKQLLRDAKAVDALHAACRASRDARDATLMSTLEARLAVLKFSARDASDAADKVLGRDLKQALGAAAALAEAGSEIVSPENAKQRTDDVEDAAADTDAAFRACASIATSVVASCGAPATTRILAGACEAWLEAPPCVASVAALAVALRLRGELSGDADGPLACALSQWLAHDADGAQRAIGALARGERLEDFVHAVRERGAGPSPQTPGKGRVAFGDPLLKALAAADVDVRGARTLGERSTNVEDEAPPALSQAF